MHDPLVNIYFTKKSTINVFHVIRNLASFQLLTNKLGFSDMNLATKLLQGVPPLIKVCTDQLTEDNNQNFAKGYPTEIFYLFIWFFW